MVFLGDIAHPYGTIPEWARSTLPWSAQPVIANLEGALVTDVDEHLRGPRLFNGDSVLEALSAIGVCVVSLANNHICDVPGALSSTQQALDEKEIAHCGAGNSLAEAAAPARLQVQGQDTAFLGFGWETIQCQAATRNKPGVNPLRPEQVLAGVRDLVAAGSKTVVLLMHWNYEMEPYPQPAHRQLAMAAIDAGASAVIGHHPHCVGGVEIYKGCPIAYSLGNWWLPQGVYFDGNVKYGDEATVQLALEWRPGEVPLCHWFKYMHEERTLAYQSSDAVTGSAAIRELTPFSGMTHEAYAQWFKINRKKQRGLPIYADFRDKQGNWFKDRYVHLRHHGLVFLQKTGLRRALRL